MKILSIDAWASDGGWDWNAWYTVGEISKEEFEKLDTDKKVLSYMRREGYINTSNKRKVYVNDDQHNLVITERKPDEQVHAETSYKAQQEAAKLFKVKKSYQVTVVLAEKDGEQVTHLPLM
jgi:DNA-binding transcriptional regulator YhcF (GntR family)